ncbi:hypothetical protein MPTK1_4g07000 [Marchantia polymorpha subsp. ruderalis]|uniref:MHD1 domain-containing protein n=2 Tax=Marchantia polymorpha TaxID=3197 RepID=A0AAF6B799_MARPO|nr:hypothetical protein MARPO_0125s0045 [Marchantia polymorpha]BBN07882.1 hypothetical protein Mp_4g07000 [Marchantia polymorpha subsp. ruderalis]PTQ30417.1 hypothetical protein MARPO_0125s0045 [Marchantia polymorpha]PTQ30418.1 hypothetical protein MARPO_0125s0045 [Marchantia polymorpha]BBN07883.1 hypothetical protein Mp_4g07000 [Marchantia polymorpha subsp. ruderalis]|eukprot:PTQ30416.1 hypothetical protein MARPO_0125s0045 [Marchantia polymorpha]
MTRASDVELLQRYRRDRRELLSFLLSSDVLKRVVMPPGAVSIEDLGLDEISVDYILDCARKGAVLELGKAIEKYHDEINLPPAHGKGLGEVYFLVTHPEFSGPPPTRSPPPIAIPLSPGKLTKNFSIRSNISHPASIGEDDEYDDADDDEELSTEIARRQLLNTTDLVLPLPPLVTGLTDDDLRETAYEVLLTSVGAAGGLISPAKEKKEKKKSRLTKTFSRSKTDKTVPQPPRATGLAGLMDTMRTQMEISVADDRRTREALLTASSTRGGRRMDSMLLPLELLCAVPTSQFLDRKFHSRWRKRQISLIEEGLLHHPYVPLSPSDRTSAELRVLINKLEEAETLPSPAGPAQHAEALRSLRGVGLALAERVGRGDHTGEVCHWADGYHLNVRLYAKLLGSVFDVLDEGQLVEEVEEILELLKSTWRVLGITQTVHDTCYTWVLFRQYIMTGEEALLQHATQQMKKIASDAQRSAQERAYMRSLRCTVEDGDTHKEMSYVQSVLVPIKQWADKQLEDYHSKFGDDAKKMEAIVTVAMVSGRLIADEQEQSGAIRNSGETTAVAKQAEGYIHSSLKLVYERIVEKLDSRTEAEEELEHPLASLAESIEDVARKEASVFAPILSKWHPHAIAIAASLLHGLYQKELKPFLDGVSHLSEDVASVLPAADSLEQYLLDLIGTVSEEGEDNVYEQQLVRYQVEVVSGTLVMRWVNTQLGSVTEWVDRTIQQERWEPVSTNQQFSGSVVEVFRIIDETTDQFFNLKLPMRLPVLKALTNGFDSALVGYTNKILVELGDKGDLIPPAPSLTRYKKDMSIKAQSKKKVADPRLPDERRSTEINFLTTVRLCVRLNTLHHILVLVDALEDHIRERWARKRPRDDVLRSNGTVPKRKANDGETKLKRPPGSKPLDELSAFDGTRKAVNVSIDKICDFTGTKIVFWDLREVLIDGLYKGSVSQSRMEKVISVLDPVLGQLCDTIDPALRDRIVLGLLQASLEGLLRVLLDGGPTRVFADTDSDMLEEDLSSLKEFFIADGDGLPRGVVENAAAPVQQILNLYSLETSIVIDSFKRASEQMASGGSVQRSGPRIATDADTLLRVLCHRLDREASKFLKKQYKLPKV